jgi:hypothetical protein
MRLEIAYYRSLDANAFNGDANGAADLIVHF